MTMRGFCKKSIPWLLTFLFVLGANWLLEASAGTVRYFDKNGNEITEEQYRRLTGRPPRTAPGQQSPSPAKKTAAEPVAAAASGKPQPEGRSAGLDGTFSLLSETIIRGFERDTAEKSDVRVLPVYEYLQLDYGRSEGDGFSFHFNGWGRKDLGDGDYFTDDPEAALLYAFAEYVDPDANFQARLGRQAVFSGVVSDSLDGIWLTAKPASWIGFSAFGGLPVALDSAAGRSGDVTYGGRVFHRLDARYEIGVSYKTVAGDQGEDEERLGGDLFFYFPGNVVLSGFSSYNLVTEGWVEHSYEFTFTGGVFNSAFFGLTGLHGLHVSMGAVLIGIVFVRSLTGQYSADRHVSVSTVSMYWHFVDAVWIFLVVVLYVGSSMTG